MTPENDPVKQRENPPLFSEPAGIPGVLPDYEEVMESTQSVSSGWLSNAKNRRCFFICFLLLLGMLMAAPLYRVLKEWRADMFLKNSAIAFGFGDNERGLALMKEGLALSPSSESVLHAVELYNARAGDAISLQKLLDRMQAGKSSPDELLGIAELEAKHGKMDLAQEAVSKLPKKLDHQQQLQLVLVQALMKAVKEGPNQAALLCLTTAQSFTGEDAAHLRNQAALYLLVERNAEKKQEGVEILFGVMREKSEISLAAARIIARLSLHSDMQGGVSVPAAEVIEVAHLLPTLPGHQSEDILLAADLEIHADPSSKEAVIKRLLAEYQNAPRLEMLDFARWMNAKRLHDEVIAFAGPDRPKNDTDWLLIVSDAETAKGDWKGLSEMLDTPAGLGIPDAVKHLFLARIATINGDSATAEDEWRSVGGSLHLEKRDTLAYIAAYEEEIGAPDQALRTYREMADREESHVLGLIGLIRLQPRSARAETLIPLYEELLAASPEFPDAEGDLIYLKLLTNRDIANASASAEKLLNAQPASLARISTAALGRLRNGNVAGALALYQSNQIDWTTAPDFWKAVCIAVLRASGNTLNADHLAASIVPGSLNPDAAKLLNYPLSDQHSKLP